MQSTDGGFLEHSKPPGFSGCVVRSSPKQLRQNFGILKHTRPHLITSIKASKQTSKLRDHVFYSLLLQRKAFAEKGRIAEGRRQSRRQTVPIPPFVHATRTFMTHCLQSKGRRQGRRRRGETKAWHAQRRAPPPRRRRRHAHQRERLDQCGV